LEETLKDAGQGIISFKLKNMNIMPCRSCGACGFPDITRIEPLLNCCRLFAEETEMRWLGGLAFGGGPLINGAFIPALGGLHEQ